SPSGAYYRRKARVAAFRVEFAFLLPQASSVPTKNAKNNGGAFEDAGSQRRNSDPDVLVELDRVTFGYDQRVVLRDISLRVPRGRVVAIMGGSGCGKTTTLRLI